jgi:hypothetical protein
MSSTSRALRYAGLLTIALLLGATPCTAQRSIDTFMDLFPPNPTLPASARELLFVGSMCDGNVCPPGAMVSHLVDDACSQTGLAGVIGGQREAHLVRVAGNADASPWGGYMCFNHGPGGKATLDLDYGKTLDMNANLTVGLATALRVDVTGDMYAGPRPVPFTIKITSGRGTAGQVTASATQNLVLDGTYTYPFASFAGVDFTDVDAISLRLDASAYAAVDLCIYNLQTNGTTVAVQPATFANVKALYR